MTITEQGIRIDCPFIELSIDEKRIRPVCKEAYLMLYEKYLRYRIVANYESADNPEGVLKLYKCNNKRTWMRSDIREIGMFRDNKNDTWAVSIKFADVDGPEWDTTDVVVANELYRVLSDYLITR